MTETARWMNWLRSNGESEKLKSPTEARMAAVRRWGGNGLLFDNLQRAKDTAKYSGTITGYATAPFGPIANDILGIGHGKIAQTVGTKVPFYAAGNTLLGQEQMKKYRKFLKEKDKELKQFLPEFEYDVAKQRFAKGGEVDIPNAPTEPDERINKLTGRPYNQDAGSAFMDELDPEKVARQGFAIGSLAKVGAVKLKGFIAEAIDEYSGGLTKPEYINDAAREIEDLTGINAGRFDDEGYDPMEADYMNVSQMSDDVDEEVEQYVMTLIKVQLNEKYPDNMPNADEINEIISKQGVDSDEYYEAMGYPQDFKEEVDYLRELKDIVDPNDSIAFDVTNALNDVRQNKNYYSFDSTAQEYIDKADEGGYGELAEFLSHSIGVDDTISELGKVKMVMSEIGSKLDDPMYAKQLEDIKESFPAVSIPKEPKDLLPEDELTERLEVYINKSIEKKPQFRGISSFAEKDFEVAFASPREMGVHVGSRGQAEFILARKLNENKAIDEFSVATRSFDVDENIVSLPTIKIPSWWKETTDRNFTTSPEKSQATQRGNTTSTYLKTQESFTNKDGVGLDYGAGLGEGAKAIGFKTYEPNPVDDFKPDYTNPSSIPNSSVDKITNLNVLNVVKKEDRDNIVKDIFRILKVDGEAIITTRGSDIYGNKAKPAVANLGDEEGSIITSSGTFQKGFTQSELEAYVQNLLGDSVTITKFKGGKAGIKITKVKPEIEIKVPYEKVSEEELDAFYLQETAKINNFQEVDWDTLTLDELNSLTDMKDEISVDVNEMNPLTMMKGYIQVKKPLVIDEDMGNWSAQNLLTTSESIFIDSIEKNLGKKIPKKKMKALEVLMSDAMEMSEIVLNDLFGDASTAVNETVAHTALTKKLQSWLNDLGFDSIKYRNTVEPLMKGDAGYDDYSYILFEPKQYKSILSSGFDTSDPRMMYNKGGLIESLTGADFWARDYNAEDRPMEERVADYEAAQTIIPTQTVVDVVDYALDSGAFDYEIKDLGLDKATLKRDMVNIAKIESSGGHLPKNKQVSSTGAQGLFQVIESTARSVIENKQFGPKAAQAAGVSLEAVNKMSKKELQDFLLNNDRGNALFSAAIIMQKLQNNRNKNKGREDFSMGGIVDEGARYTNGDSYLEGRTR